jgi:hypothetical protein
LHERHDDPGVSGEAIAGIVPSLVITIGIIIALVYLLSCRKKKIGRSRSRKC